MTRRRAGERSVGRLPLGLAELLGGGEPLAEVRVLREAVVVGCQLQQFDLRDHLELLRRGKKKKKKENTFVQPFWGFGVD